MAGVPHSPRGHGGRTLRRRVRALVGRTVVRPVRRVAARARAAYASLVREPRVARLLSGGSLTDERTLVIGSPRAVRRTLPRAPLDVVGTDPADPAVSVVSSADEEGSLPRRWGQVVVSDPAATAATLRAAAGACLPGGTVAVVAWRTAAPGPGSGLTLQRVGRRGRLALHTGPVSR